MIPLRDENQAQSPAVVTWTLIVLNVVAFFYELMLGPELRGFVFDWGLVPARVSASVSGGEESVFTAALPLLTSMFLHGGWMHLIGNLWYLAIFGDNVEDRLGHLGFLVFYLVAGLAGGFLHFFFNASSRVPTVGASGAIAGVLGAYLVAFPGARIVTLVPLFPFFQLMALPSIVVLGLWFVYQFFSGALSLAWAGRAASGGTAWWGHIGGFAFGVIAMMALGRRRRSRAWEA
jgi:membrane associated rhomboid family serine protease